MYLFKVELKEKLLDGRKINYIAKKVGISREWLYNILNGVCTTTKTTAYCIVKSCGTDNEIEDYFDRTGE